MMYLQEVAEFGSHLHISMTHSDVSAFCIDSQQFVVNGLRGDTHTDGLPLLGQYVLIYPFLALNMLSDVPVLVACSGIGIGTSRAVQEVMQRLIIMLQGEENHVNPLQRTIGGPRAGPKTL
jgi:hypothetical protein